MATKQTQVSIKSTTKPVRRTPKKTAPSLDHPQTPIFNTLYAKSTIAIKAAVRQALTGNKK